MGVSRRAVLSSAGKVVNVVLADDSWRPATGLTCKLVADGELVNVGDTWSGSKWVPGPPSTPVPEPSNGLQFEAIVDAVVARLSLENG